MKSSRILSVIGLAVAFAAFYIIMVQVNYSLSYNKAIKDSDRVYAVGLPSFYTEGHYALQMPYYIAQSVFDAIPECEGCGSLQIYNSEITITSVTTDGTDPVEFEINYRDASPGAVDVLGIEVLEGSVDETYIEKGKFAISRSAAEKFDLGIGDVVSAAGFERWTAREMTVAAIFEDLPEDTNFARTEAFAFNEYYAEDISEWSFNFFVKLPAGADLEEIQTKATEQGVKLYLDAYEKIGVPVSEEAIEDFKSIVDYRLFPLRDIYFEPLISESEGEQGSKSTTMVLIAIAILIIAIAFINYINFFLAEVPRRIRNVNIRKSLGASRAELVRSFLLESLGLVAAGLAIGACIVLLFNTSTLAGLISCSAVFSKNLGIVVFTIVVTLLLSVIIGLYPAFYISSFSPALTLKGNFGTSASGRTFRNVLVGLQFTISLALLICSSFITLQRRYMLNHDLGFDKENILYSYLLNSLAESTEIEDKLLQDPRIVDVSWASGAIIKDLRMGWGRELNGEIMYFQLYSVAVSFPKFLGINIVEGRDFTESDKFNVNGTFIFNEAACDKYGVKVGDRLQGHQDEPAEVVGICRDFNFRGLQNSIEPLALYVYGPEQWNPSNTLFVRTAAGVDVRDVIKYIKKSVIELAPDMDRPDFEIYFFEENVQEQYVKEENLSKLINLFTLLAVIISLIGVSGLIIYDTQYQRKEIAVRKVHGATITEVLKQFNLKYIKILVISFVIAAPVSVFIIASWLRGFAYKVAINPLVFILDLLLVLLITVVAVSACSYSAAKENPAKVLNKE